MSGWLAGCNLYHIPSGYYPGPGLRTAGPQERFHPPSPPRPTLAQPFSLHTPFTQRKLVSPALRKPVLSLGLNLLAWSSKGDEMVGGVGGARWLLTGSTSSVWL